MNLGVALLLISNLFFAIMPLLAKKAMLLGLSSSQVALVRFFIGFLCACGYHFFVRRLVFRNLKMLSLRGILGGGSVLLYFLAIQGISPGIATLLNNSWPVFSMLLSIFILKESITISSIFAILITSLGIVFITLGSGTVSVTYQNPLLFFIYVACGVVSALFSGAAVVTIRSARQSEGYWELFFFFCLGGLFITGGPGLFTWNWPSQEAWMYLLGIGISSLVGQLFMTYALKEVHSGLSNLLMLIAPVLTLIGGILFFEETLGWKSMVGTMITLLGVAYGLLVGRKPVSSQKKDFVPYHQKE